MKSFELRETFLNYFEKNGHARVRSSSLVPQNDPTLFFTNAGMVQFKELFLGTEKRDYKRATTSQKCMRVSGKHNDLENVGHTPRHHTFFEMLGNFSFGDYFKKEAIAFAWEFLTKEIGLSKDRLWITVFNDDSEAHKLWQKHVSKERIFKLGEKDNFWAMGDTGPCGPCSEIMWDFGKGSFSEKDLATDRFMEIWNLVFMQFERDVSGKLSKLSKPSIDTGMGLERLSAVVQGKVSNWETDLFVPIITKIAEITGKKTKVSKEDEIALRVIADHIRGTAFLIADGVVPSNEGRGYVLRRIMRRAIRYGKKLGCDKPFFSKIAHVAIDEMGESYPELVTHQKFIEKVIVSEEERFFETLGKGLEILKNSYAKFAGKSKKILPGDIIFKLYDTYGFPKDLTEIISAEHGFSLDEDGFAKLMENQRDHARANWKGSGEEKVSPVYRDLLKDGIKSVFVGYTNESAEGRVAAILKQGKILDSAQTGDSIELISDKTPFYGESGGQQGDMGMAVGHGVELEIKDTKRPLPQLVSHHALVKKGTLHRGDKLTFAVDSERRDAIRKNHTATHLLHKALREILGEHVKQAGSLVGRDRLRFDFSHFEAVGEKNLGEIERDVNENIRRNLKVTVEEVSYTEAVKRGALAFFGEKYGEVVRLVDAEGISIELCGGIHVKATGEIGIFKILSEGSVAAGIRRIEAVTGKGAEEYIAGIENERKEVAKFLKSNPSEILDRVQKLAKQVETLEKSFKNAQKSKPEDWKKGIKNINGIEVYICKADISDRKTLDMLTEEYLKDMPSGGIVVVGSLLDDKIAVSCAVSKSSAKAHAGNIVRAISEEFGGKGGGRPDFAQGGGRAVEKFGEFEEITLKCIKKILEDSTEYGVRSTA